MKKELSRAARDLEKAYQEFLVDLRDLKAKRRALLERFQKQLERTKVEKIRKTLE